MKVAIQLKDNTRVDLEVPHDADVDEAIQTYFKSLGRGMAEMRQYVLPSREHKDSALMRPTADLVNQMIDSIVWYVGEGMPWNWSIETVGMDSMLAKGIFWTQTILPTARRIISEST